MVIISHVLVGYGDYMKTIYISAREEFSFHQKITACIGYFDGLHKGHQALISKVLNITKKDHTIPALISFEPDPWTVVRKINNPPHILAPIERHKIMEDLGIELCIILVFDEEMANLGVDEFHENILHKLGVQTLICGFDFHYARSGYGSIDTLQMQSYFKVEIINKVEEQDEKISSSRIERYITHGDMEKVTNLMTRSFKVSGFIKKGNQIGRTYHFPTANLALDYTYVMPKRGVYIGNVEWKNICYPAIINIGNNPTFNYQQTLSIEAHILNFHQDLYDEFCSFYFYKRIRDEQHFPSKDALIEQLMMDKKCAIQYFKQKKESVPCD